MPSSTAHIFDTTQTNNKICSNCYVTIRNAPNVPCDHCRHRSSLSDALLSAANAARQQIQSILPTNPPTNPRTLPLAPISSSVILPAKIVSTIIRNREKVAFSILAGSTFTQHKERELFTGGSMSRSTWFHYQKEVLKAIELVEKKSEEEVVNEIKSRGRWMAVADGGWSQRRGASHHAFIIMDAESKKIIHSEILDKKLEREIQNKNKNNSNSNQSATRISIVQPGNCESTSQGMEGVAFRRSLEWLHDHHILRTMTDFVSDQSSTIELELKTNPRTQHVVIRNDPGHMALNFKRSLDSVLGAAQLVKGMSSRMES